MHEQYKSPLNIPLITRETAFSFMSRMASIGGTSASDFGLDIGLTLTKIVDGDPVTVRRLAQIGGANEEALLEWTPSKAARARRSIRGEMFPSLTVLASEVRGCPVCLQEDAKSVEASPERVMAIRGDWLIPHVTICLRHEHALVPLWKEPRRDTRYDTVKQFAKIAPLIISGNLSSDFREPTDFDEWIGARLVGDHRKTWLDQFPLNSAASFCRLLGCALMKREQILLSNVAPGSQWAFYQMGFEVASEGAEAIYDVLFELNRLAEPKQGPKAVFPLLYERLAYDYADDPDYAPFRSLLSSHFLKTWPVGVGDEILGEPVAERRLHSVVTAAKEYGVDPRRLRKLLEASGLIDSKLPDAWAVFDAKSSSELMKSLVELVTAQDFWEGLTMSRSQFNLLVEDGVLVPKLNDAATKHIWDPSEGQLFLNRLLSGASILRQAQHGWEHIAKTAQRLKIRPADIVHAIWDGRIQSVGKHVWFEGYRAVHVYYDEVATVLGSDEATEMSIEVFAKAIGLAEPIQLKRLTQNGHTPSTEMRNPKTKALQQYFTKGDAEAFHEKFVTLRTLAKSQGESWQRISVALKAKGVSRFSPDGKNYGNLFLKLEAEAAIQ